MHNASYIAWSDTHIKLAQYNNNPFTDGQLLTHWGRVTHICVSKLTIIGSDNGLSPGRRQAIIWTNDGILLIGPLGTNFSEILFGIQTFSFNKMHLKMSSAKWRPFCIGLNVLTCPDNVTPEHSIIATFYTNDIRPSCLLHHRCLSNGNTDWWPRTTVQ